jgi:Ca-activated chloride channel family protein
MDLQFQHPEFFIALLAVPFVGLLFWYLLLWKKSTAKKIGDEKLVGELTKNHSPLKFIIKFSLAAIALIAIIIAIINPQRPGSMDKVERKGVDVMIALDVSNSMLAEDIKPNRLEKAKQLINRLMSDLRDDRVGLVLFAGRAYMQMPLTTDHAAAKMYVQNANPLIVPTQGTMISEALKLCATAFNSKDRKYKSIILITDGEDHDPATMEVAQQLTANGVMVNTVGVGSPLGTPIPNPLTGQFKKDEQGNTILSKLNEGQLKQLAAATKGIYVNNEDVSAASSAIMRQLSTIAEVALEDAAFKDYIHYFPWFIALAIILLLGEFLLPERKFSIAILLLICSSGTQAQTANARNGNKFYKEGKYDRAIAEYKKGVKSTSAGTPTRYNLGNAYYRSKQYDESATTYRDLLPSTNDPALKQKTYYNLGVSLSRQNKLEESIEAYKNAVKLDPADEDARINLQKALMELKKKQPPKKENEENKKKEQKKQQKKDQQKQPPKSNLSKKEVERLLKALQQREQQVQQKMQQNRSRSAGRQEKDW